MHFVARHVFRGTPEAVAAILSDPTFYAELRLPDVGPSELIERRDDDEGRLLRMRYQHTGDLHPIAQRLLGGERLSWLQDLRIAEDHEHGTITFAAEKDPRRLHGSATFRLVADGEETVRLLEGDLVVAVPGVGSMAERRIVPGILARLGVEADAIASRLRG